MTPGFVSRMVASATPEVWALEKYETANTGLTVTVALPATEFEEAEIVVLPSCSASRSP